MPKTLHPITAIDILPGGTIRPVDEDWPAAAPGEGALWRWLHFERTAPGLADWCADRLPLFACAGLLLAETRPRADFTDDGIILSLRAMNLNPGQEAEDMVSVRLWITRELIVSTRNRRMFLIDDLLKDMQAGRAPSTTIGLVARMSDRMTERIEVAAAEQEESLDEVEERLLDAQPDPKGAGEVEMALIARSVLKLRRHMLPQREALQRLSSTESPLIGRPDRFALREVANRTTRAVEELDAIRERLASLRSYLDSHTNTRLARNGFILSVVAAIFLPLTFLTGLFGVNLGGLPGAHHPLAFAMLTAATVGLGLGLFGFFRWKGWF